MIKRCKKCGREFEYLPGIISDDNRKYCNKCTFKYNIPTQEELAKRAKRSFVDKVQTDTDKADSQGLSYGQYMARKEKEK